jgi:hypothetical protein
MDKGDLLEKMVEEALPFNINVYCRINPEDGAVIGLGLDPGDVSGEGGSIMPFALSQILWSPNMVEGVCRLAVEGNGLAEKVIFDPYVMAEYVCDILPYLTDPEETIVDEIVYMDKHCLSDELVGTRAMVERWAKVAENQ